MGKKVEILGQTFGRLKVISESGKTNSGKIKWTCECICGNQITVPSNSLISGNTKSCGCLQKEIIGDSNKTHGLRWHPLYKVWRSIKIRCYDIKSKPYKYYGGRGIVICSKWKDSFENFYNDVIVGYEKGLQLDRKDNDGNYEPDNVRWVTAQQNSFNTRGSDTSSSKYKGVGWDKKARKWRSYIGKDGNLRHLGLFSEEIEAAKAYNEAASELFGEYAYLNIIEEN